jgi:NAD(P)-dependent dehydrogenase (short-subunit alcohol dehydrogenase family)
MTKNLEGKTAVITGGTEGTGLAAAKGIRQGGCVRLHHVPSPEGTRRGRKGNRQQRTKVLGMKGNESDHLSIRGTE